MITKRTRKLLSNVIVLLVIGFQSGYAANIILEAEDFDRNHGYLTDNIEVREQGSSPYSGGKYTIVAGDEGEPALHFTVAETGEYTIKFFYCGGENNWYNLYEGSVNNKLTWGQISYSASLTSHEFNYNLNAGTDYYVGVYGHTGTIYDYAQIIKDGTIVATLEAEDFETGYKPENVVVVGGESVTYSGGKYTLVTGSEGEAALPFSVSTTGTYKIRVHYHGGSNTYFNLYEGQDKVSGFSDIKIDDLALLGYYHLDNVTLDAGKTYYVGVYGNTGTIFDYAEIAPQGGVMTQIEDAENLNCTVYYQGKNIVVNTKDSDFEYILYNTTGMIVAREKLNSSSCIIDTHNFAKGTYIMQINSPSIKLCKKISVF